MRSKTGCVVHLKVDSSPRKRGLSADKVDSFPRECGLSADKVDSFLGEVIRLTPCFSWGSENRKDKKPLKRFICVSLFIPPLVKTSG